MSIPTVLQVTGKSRRHPVTSKQNQWVKKLTVNARQLRSTNFCGDPVRLTGFRHRL